MLKKKHVFICGAVRTPHGAFYGALKDMPTRDLGASVIAALLAGSAVPPEAVGGVYMGEALTAGEGQNPARHAALRAGLPRSCPAETINKVCASSLAALRHAAQAIWLDEAHVMLAGGMENMSRSPYFLWRTKRTMGDKSPEQLFASGAASPNAYAYDSMLYDGLTEHSELARPHMGVLADRCAHSHGILREEQEEYARESIARAHLASISASCLQVIDMPTPHGGYLTRDETLRFYDAERVRKLPSAFGEGGSITAATSSQLADGASAVLLASAEGVRRHHLRPIARLRDFAVFSGEPAGYPTAPAEAIRILLERNTLCAADIDLFEVNEAFAVVPLHVMKTLHIPIEKMNIHGGAIAIGHPLGASGTRIAGLLALALGSLEKRRGIAVACNGGGEAVAALLERV